MKLPIRQSIHKLGRRPVQLFSRPVAAVRSDRLFSNDASNDQNSNSSSQHHFDFRTSRLGLAPKWIQPSLETITQLPEVQVAMEALAGTTKPSSSTEGDLDRATQVLESMQRAGNEHMAVVALRAELQQRMGNHNEAHKSVCQLESLWSEEKRSSTATTAIEMSLIKAKALWYKGDLEAAEECCEELLDQDHIQDLPLHYASALTGYGLSKIGRCDSLDDAFVVRDPCRMALKQLEQNSQQSGVALIAAHLNLGVAEAVYGSVVGKERDLDVPMDRALKTWTQGMTVLEGRSPRSSTEKAATDALQVRLEANLAWGILKIDDDMDDIVPEATEHAGNAINVLDSITTIDNNDKEYLRRILTILSVCFHKAGKAVTAEGLLQSATSMPSIGCTLTKLDERSAFESYSDLCNNWDKRQSDADRYAAKAKELDSSLPNDWQGKDSIVSSLWFWTPDELAY